MVVTLVWGSTFVLVKDTVAQVTPLLFLAVRFMLGATALALAVTLTGRWRGLTIHELGWGTLIGLALGLGYAAQTIGLQWTTASNAGFITGLSVALVPVIGLFVLRHAPGRWAWVGVLLATAGLALLSLRLDEGPRANWGDLIVLGGALAFALQIVLVARVAAWTDPSRLTTLQILISGLLCALLALFFERPVPGLRLEVWASAAFLGLVASGAAILIQVSVQRFTPATHTALIFTLEPVFAAIFGFWLQGDRLGIVALMGAGLIVTGMAASEFGAIRRQ